MVGRRPWIGLIAVVLVAAVPAAAQDGYVEGYYDRDGYFVPLEPGRGQRYAEPPVYADPPPGAMEAPGWGLRMLVPPEDVPEGRRAARAPGVPRYVETPRYAEPPPVYAEPPPDYSAPPGWGRRVLVVPPEDIPETGRSRPREGDRLRRDWREAAPQGEIMPPEAGRQEYPPEAYPPEAYPPGADARGYPSEAYPPETYPPPGADQGGYPPQAYPPGPAEDRLRERERGSSETARAYIDWSGAIRALVAYAPAKRAAVELQDVHARMSAVKQANAWLVAHAVAPMTAGSIAAIDKLLGIATTPETTALPGAGTVVEQPKVKGGGDFDRAIDRIADYAAVRSEVLRAGSEEDRKAIDAVAAERLAAAEVTLTEAERLGLDAYLGIAGPAAEVAQKDLQPPPR